MVKRITSDHNAETTHLSEDIDNAFGSTLAGAASVDAILGTVTMGVDTAERR